MEYSNDGVTFEKMGSVNGAGNSSELHEYEFRASSQIDFVGYYRLVQYDIDGTSTKSDVIAVECVDNEMTAYMVNGSIVISSSFEIENVRVLDMAGRIVFNGQSNTIDVSKMGVAIYFLEVETKESTQRLKVIGSGM